MHAPAIAEVDGRSAGFATKSRYSVAHVDCARALTTDQRVIGRLLDAIAAVGTPQPFEQADVQPVIHLSIDRVIQKRSDSSRMADLDRDPSLRAGTSAVDWRALPQPTSSRDSVRSAPGHAGMGVAILLCRIRREHRQPRGLSHSNKGTPGGGQPIGRQTSHAKSDDTTCRKGHGLSNDHTTRCADAVARRDPAVLDRLFASRRRRELQPRFVPRRGQAHSVAANLGGDWRRE